MGYQTGTSTGPDDLLDKLRIWLLAEGWTVNLWDDDNTTYRVWTGLVGTGKRLHVQKTATDSTVMYFNFRSVNRGVIFEDHYSVSTLQGYGKYYAEATGIGINGSTGYNVANAWDYQPGAPVGTSSKSWGACITELSLTAIPAYYFFSQGDTFVVGVEYESGKFQWIMFGCLEKSGVYTGGQFFVGSCSGYMPSEEMLGTGAYLTIKGCILSGQYGGYGRGAVYLDVDSVAGWRAYGNSGSVNDSLAKKIEWPGYRPNDAATSYITHNTFGSLLFRRSPNFYNALAPMMPAYTLVLRASANYCFLGNPTNVRLINPLYYDPGDEYTLGSDVWKIFPMHSKADAAAAAGKNVGIAILKEV